MDVRPDRKQTLALRWLISYARSRSERTMAERLAGEILDAKNSMGGAFKKKEETHRMAEAEQGVRTLQVLIGGQLPLIGQFKTKE